MDFDPIAFPQLDATEIEAVRQLGEPAPFAAEETLYRCGAHPLDCFVITSGTVEIIDQSGDQARVLLEYGAGHFTGDIAVLTGLPSIVTCRAKTACETNVGPGGQAGSSARIENYAGFPAGLSGHELAQRTYLQALKFGATFSSPQAVEKVERQEDGTHKVATTDGGLFRTKTALITTGVSYRTLGVTGINRLRGCGIYYAATQIEALLCEDRPVHIIGAGNSAGQAAMYLSKFSKDVSLVVRGDNLHKSMSSYLSERVESNPRVRIRLLTELRGVEGSSCLERLHLENTATGKTTLEESSGAFIFVGASPCTGFLGDTILKDDKGYVMTGNDVVSAGKWPLPQRLPSPLETSCPGIYAAGDCRSRTTKRVAFAVGDGALAVTCVHELLGTYN